MTSLFIYTYMYIYIYTLYSTYIYIYGSPSQKHLEVCSICSETTACLFPLCFVARPCREHFLPAKLASTVSSIAFGRSTDGEVTTMVKSQLDKSQHTGHQPQQHRQPMDIDMLEALMVPMQAGCPSNRNHKVLFASQLTTQLPHIVTVTLQL